MSKNKKHFKKYNLGKYQSSPTTTKLKDVVDWDKLMRDKGIKQEHFKKDK